MKKTLLLTIALTINGLVVIGQQQRAAVIGLSKMKTNVTFTNGTSDVSPVCYLEEGKGYNDSLVFAMLKSKVDSIATVVGYALIPQDSVLNAEKYKARSLENAKLAKHRDPKQFTPEILAPGYGSVETNGLGGINYMEDYFSIPSNPDVIIHALYDFDVNITTIGGVETVRLKAYVHVAAYSKKKRIFKMATYYTDPKKIAFAKNPKSCWGNDITEDISQLQMDVIKKTINKLDEDMEKVKADVKKFNEKNK